MFFLREEPAHYVFVVCEKCAADMLAAVSVIQEIVAVLNVKNNKLRDLTVRHVRADVILPEFTIDVQRIGGTV